MATETVELFGCPFDRVTMAEAVADVEAAIADRTTLTQSCGVNLDQLLKMLREPAFRDIILQCEQITADGAPIVWMSKLFRTPLPERVASVDIMEALLPVAAEKGYRIFMLGTKEDLLQRARASIEARYPGIQIVGARNGYFTTDDEPEIAAQINAAKTDILLIAITSPKKEQFVENNRSVLEVPFVMGVGGAFDIEAGLHRRAPKLIRRVGLEWTWRVALEPRRLGPRAVAQLNFLPFLAREIWARKVRPRFS